MVVVTDDIIEISDVKPYFYDWLKYLATRDWIVVNEIKMDQVMFTFFITYSTCTVIRKSQICSPIDILDLCVSAPKLFHVHPI